MRWITCAAAFITAASPAFGAQEAEDDGSYRMLLSAGVGRFSGDYGEPETTTLDVLSFTGRRYFDWGEVQVSLPLLSIDGSADVQFIDGQPVAGGGGSTPGARRKETGVGDVVVRGEYYLRTGSSTSPWIIGLLRVKLPTGDETRGLGSGSTDVETGLGLIQRTGPVIWLADIGYTFVGDATGSDPSNELRLGAGASVPFGEDERSSSYVYLENRTSRFEGSDDRRSIAVGVSTGLTESRRVRLSGSLFFGLTDSSEDVGLYVTLGRRF